MPKYNTFEEKANAIKALNARINDIKKVISSKFDDRNADRNYYQQRSDGLEVFEENYQLITEYRDLVDDLTSEKEYLDNVEKYDEELEITETADSLNRITGLLTERGTPNSRLWMAFSEGLHEKNIDLRKIDDYDNVFYIGSMIEDPECTEAKQKLAYIQKEISKLDGAFKENNQIDPVFFNSVIPTKYGSYYSEKGKAGFIHAQKDFSESILRSRKKEYSRNKERVDEYYETRKETEKLTKGYKDNYGLLEKQLEDLQNFPGALQDEAAVNSFVNNYMQLQVDKEKIYEANRKIGELTSSRGEKFDISDINGRLYSNNEAIKDVLGKYVQSLDPSKEENKAALEKWNYDSEWLSVDFDETYNKKFSEIRRKMESKEPLSKVEKDATEKMIKELSVLNTSVGSDVKLTDDPKLNAVKILSNLSCGQAKENIAKWKHDITREYEVYNNEIKKDYIALLNSTSELGENLEKANTDYLRGFEHGAYFDSFDSMSTTIKEGSERHQEALKKLEEYEAKFGFKPEDRKNYLKADILTSEKSQEFADTLALNEIARHQELIDLDDSISELTSTLDLSKGNVSEEMFNKAKEAHDKAMPKLGKQNTRYYGHLSNMGYHVNHERMDTETNIGKINQRYIQIEGKMNEFGNRYVKGKYNLEKYTDSLSETVRNEMKKMETENEKDYRAVWDTIHQRFMSVEEDLESWENSAEINEISRTPFGRNITAFGDLRTTLRSLQRDFRARAEKKEIFFREKKAEEARLKREAEKAAREKAQREEEEERKALEEKKRRDDLIAKKERAFNRATKQWGLEAIKNPSLYEKLEENGLKGLAENLAQYAFLPTAEDKLNMMRSIQGDKKKLEDFLKANPDMVNDDTRPYLNEVFGDLAKTSKKFIDEGILPIESVSKEAKSLSDDFGSAKSGVEELSTGNFESYEKGEGLGKDVLGAGRDVENYGKFSGGRNNIQSKLNLENNADLATSVYLDRNIDLNTIVNGTEKTASTCKEKLVDEAKNYLNGASSLSTRGDAKEFVAKAVSLMENKTFLEANGEKTYKQAEFDEAISDVREAITTEKSASSKPLEYFNKYVNRTSAEIADYEKLTKLLGKEPTSGDATFVLSSNRYSLLNQRELEKTESLLDTPEFKNILTVMGISDKQKNDAIAFSKNVVSNSKKLEESFKAYYAKYNEMEKKTPEAAAWQKSHKAYVNALASYDKQYASFENKYKVSNGKTVLSQIKDYKALRDKYSEVDKLRNTAKAGNRKLLTFGKESAEYGKLRMASNKDYFVKNSADAYLRGLVGGDQQKHEAFLDAAREYPQAKTDLLKAVENFSKEGANKDFGALHATLMEYKRWQKKFDECETVKKAGSDGKKVIKFFMNPTFDPAKDKCMEPLTSEIKPLIPAITAEFNNLVREYDSLEINPKDKKLVKRDNAKAAVDTILSMQKMKECLDAIDPKSSEAKNITKRLTETKRDFVQTKSKYALETLEERMRDFYTSPNLEDEEKEEIVSDVRKQIETYRSLGVSNDDLDLAIDFVDQYEAGKRREEFIGKIDIYSDIVNSREKIVKNIDYIKDDEKSINEYIDEKKEEKSGLTDEEFVEDVIKNNEKDFNEVVNDKVNALEESLSLEETLEDVNLEALKKEYENDAKAFKKGGKIQSDGILSQYADEMKESNLTEEDKLALKGVVISEIEGAYNDLAKAKKKEASLREKFGGEDKEKVSLADLMKAEYKKDLADKRTKLNTGKAIKPNEPEK